jgi:hypothetical protein
MMRCHLLRQEDGVLFSFSDMYSHFFPRWLIHFSNSSLSSTVQAGTAQLSVSSAAKDGVYGLWVFSERVFFFTFFIFIILGIVV